MSIALCFNSSSMFIRNASRTYANKTSECRLLTESYRDKEGIPRHKTILNLSKLPQDISSIIERQVSGKKMVSLGDITQEDNRSLGEVSVLYRLAQRVGITKILQQYLGKHIASLVLAMVINRISLPKARCSLREWLGTTYLPEILEAPLEEFHHNKLYHALFKLNDKQDEIEDKLWETTKQKESDLTLMLYDITSTYLEGEQNELGAYGYSRDKKKGKKQLTIALVATPQGRPVTVEALPGNTTDKTTLLRKIKELKERFSLKEIVYVFDRGMVDEVKLETLRSKEVKYITALKRDEIRKLVADKAPIQLGMFDKQDLVEYSANNRRYIICKSDCEERAKKKRELLLAKTEEELEKIKTSIAKKQLKDPLKIAARAERHLNRFKMKRYFTISIKERYFSYSRKKDYEEEADILDQLYVLETTEKKLPAQKVQQGYKNLSVIERDFRMVKSSLEVRPANHVKEETTKGHIFVCFLALYLKKELEMQLSPLLKQKHTFSSLLTQLKEIRQSKLTAGEHKRYIVNEPNPMQKKILSKLKMRILPLQTSL
jgi:transposase